MNQFRRYLMINQAQLFSLSLISHDEPCHIKNGFKRNEYISKGSTSYMQIVVSLLTRDFF